jgi:hypothetical protein
VAGEGRGSTSIVAASSIGFISAVFVKENMCISLLHSKQEDLFGHIKHQVKSPLTSFEGNELNGWRCSKCSGIAPFRCFRFIKKNATSAPTTRIDTTMPAIAPAPMPELPSEFELSLPLECWPGLFPRLRECGGAVKGGGGGAGPVLQELPPVL